ncbi:DUF2218 domain-containing protein [Demequina sp. SYSU T00068]|uniref:DUF2218 domain-containing protein n=1 Tax=Demequina lignilytica TaxID=3051663 RepID=UPI002609FE3F|nr:DUF2218 domain-containing protein [Demequina sp. SYSU T00068]MDN4491626.1 DUF2218 domain-containing protein [Demequina sp. SYSU T00068]
MTLSTTGRFPTDRPERYLKQLCSHLGNKLDATYEGGDGRIVLGTAIARLTATPGSLEIAVSGAEDADVHRVMGVVGSHLDRFAQKDGVSTEWDDAELAAAAKAAREAFVAARKAAAEAEAGAGS